MSRSDPNSMPPSVDAPSYPALKDRDFSHLEEAQRKSDQALKELNALCPLIGKAKMIREVHGDRAKRFLATAVKPFLQDNSATAADTMGRSSTWYAERMIELESELENAEGVIAKWVYWQAALEAARTQISSERALLGM